MNINGNGSSKGGIIVNSNSMESGDLLSTGGLGVGEESFADGSVKDGAGGSILVGQPPLLHSLYSASTSTVLSKQQREAVENCYRELLTLSAAANTEAATRPSTALSAASLASSSDIYLRAQVINTEINTHIEAAKRLEKELHSLKRTYTQGEVRPKQLQQARGASRGRLI